MFKNNNPLIRSLVGAATVGSVLTLAFGLALGSTKDKAPDAYRAAVYAVLVGAAGGAVFGLKSKPNSQQDRTIDDRRGWQDWRNFVVTRKVAESEDITSFYLQPEDKQEIPNFKPGQYLTIKLDIPGQAKPVIRTYTLSDYVEPCDHYRLSIKRERQPKGQDVPAGLASNFMHDLAIEGTVIAAKPPSGKFILDVQQSLPAVLVSNGVGITPMMSMAKAATQLRLDRTIWFVHGARDGSHQAFRHEVMELAAQNSKLMVHYAYSRPTAEDRGRYQSTGYVDTALLLRLVGQEAEYYLCGSPPFLQSLRDGLKQAGIPDRRISFEVFTSSKAGVTESAPTAEPAEITFTKSSKTVTWQPEDGSILELAEANGLNPPFSCRQGICGTCMCKLTEGEVEYLQPPTAEIEPGSVLICISRPKTALAIDI